MPRSLALYATLVFSLTAGGCRRRGGSVPRRASSRPAVTHVAPLAAHRRAPHAWGRAGDLTLTRPSGTRLTVATAPDARGHRPMRGAIVDVGVQDGDATDPLLWWRPVWIDAAHHTHPVVAHDVASHRCAGGTDGVVTRGHVEGAQFESTVCGDGEHGFVVRTTVTGLPAGSQWGDEVHPGIGDLAVEGRGSRWEGEVSTGFLALARGDVAVRIESDHGHAPVPVAKRAFIRIAQEVFPSAVTWVAPSNTWTRRVRIVHGDVFDVLWPERVPAAGVHAVTLSTTAPLPAEVELLDTAGAVLLQGTLTAAQRSLSLPAHLGASLRLRDARGIASPRLELGDAGSRTAVELPEAPAGTVAFRVTDPAQHPLPVHVLFHRLDGEDPMVRLGAGDRGRVGGRSAYLLDGRGSVALAPGRYRVTVSRGPGWTLSESDVTLTAGQTETLRATLRAVVPPGWTAADFHLHMAPSPDSPVTLEERVASLACNGVDLAVATDHNRITDLDPATRALGLSDWLTVVAGDEITSTGAPLWGHFNAYPLPVPEAQTSAEDAVPPYHEQTPAAMFAAARAAGATLVQVNHPRMPPSIGYFDLTHLDARTGHGDDTFSDDFDVLEAFNGIWLETPARVREGLLDVIALARRGHRVAITGNSDSHRLLHEEAGYPRTWVQVPPTPRETLARRALTAVRRGATSVSSGPFVEVSVNGVQPGGTLTLPAAQGSTLLQVRVRVTAPAWVPVESVEIWRNDEVVQRLAVRSAATDGVRYEGEVTVPVFGDAAIAAWAEATTPLPDVLPYRDARAIGFTGPVWIDYDRDGRVRVPPAGP